MFQNWSRTTKWLVCLGVAAVIVVAIVLVVVLQPKADDEVDHLGAIATDAAPCHEVGEKLLRAGGNAVDVVIGILLCEGVSSAQSMGLGGGFLMTVYNRKTKESFVMNARETAPLAATETMYNGTADLSLYGGLAVAVPGELVGYDVLHKKFGKLPWRQLVEPTIKLCEDGVPIIQYVANILQNKKERIKKSPSLSKILLDANTGDVLKKGDLMKRTALARTLKVVAEEGGRALHSGSLTKAFAKDLADYGSIITEEDLRHYEPRLIENPTVAELPGGFRLIAPPPPGSGPLLAHFLMLTADMVKTPLDDVQYHRIVEAMKFVYAARTDFGDQNFVPAVVTKSEQLMNKTFVEEIKSKILVERGNSTSTDPKFYGASWSAVDPKGTAHVAVVTEDFAVSVTSTINTEYGCLLVSESTGIILNNEMDDFSSPGVNSFYGVPPSEANFIRPGKIPQSSMTPSVILDADGDVRLIIGASGGTRITSAVGLVTLSHLYLGIDLDEAIKTKRLHHQLMPMAIQFEKGFPSDLREALGKYGHASSDLSTTASSVMAIAVNGNGRRYHPSADARREGVTATVVKG